MYSVAFFKNIYNLIVIDKYSELIKRAMGKYVSKDVMKKVVSNLDKLNVTGGYYNDICYPTLDSKIDLSIEDRQKMFSESNETVCQEDCFLSDYDEVNHRAKCSCNVIDAILDRKSVV